MTTATQRTVKYSDPKRAKTEVVYLSKAMRGLGRMEEKERRALKGRRPYREGVKLCIERARLITESYKETEGEPMVIRRAKALAHILDQMTIYILPWERIVGNIASEPNSVITYPELWWRWLDKAIDKEYSILLKKEQIGELHEIHKYWQKLAVHGYERQLLPKDVLPYWFYTNHGVFSWIHGGRTGVPNYEKLFRVGLKGIIAEAKARLEEINSTPEVNLKARDYLEQKSFLEAAIISLEAAIRFGQRFAEKALGLAEQEKDEERKKELAEIAEVCAWVPGNPPRTLHEALQCYWFITLITRQLDLQTPGLGDRFDQIMYPFYKKDKEEDMLTREEARELIEHLWLKMNEEGQLIPPAQGAGGTTLITARVLTIGGINRDGDDVTNEISELVLEATKEIRLAQPAVAIRLHRNTPREFLIKITDTLKECVGGGLFSFFNDEMMIPYLMSLGIPLEEAREYSTEGCMRWIIPGKAMGMRALGGFFALPKCLEYALNQGIDKSSGKQWGYPTPDPLTFTSLEEIIEAYLTQVKHFFAKQVAIYNIVDVLDEERLPQPFLSALFDGCLERGQDCRKYKYFPNTIIQPIGQVTLVNSLAALKKLVFEEKKVTMAELLEALKNNWEGKEELRQMFLKVPKFGNDDDFVDLLARDVYLKTTQAFRSFKNIWGGSFLEDGTGGSTYFAYSGLTGATPDGRKDSDLFNDGTISPAVGTDQKGPTAVLKSVAKIDHARTFTHLLNQKFLPQYLGGNNRERFVAYLKTFVDLGIHHIQFNIIDRQTLLDAQEHPENYSSLVVRVAGFSAYFVDLEKELQDQIIARTEQGFYE
jgi:formate C-acetyltransferase